MQTTSFGCGARCDVFAVNYFDAQEFCTNKPKGFRSRQSQSFRFKMAKLPRLELTVDVHGDFDTKSVRFKLLAGAWLEQAKFCSSIVKLVQEFIRFCACELMICGLAELVTEGQCELLGPGFVFGVLFPFEMATKAVTVRLHLLHHSHLTIRCFYDLVTFAIADLSRFAFFILLTAVLQALLLENRFSDVSSLVPETTWS
ncbi:hypothetical protein ACROYT_G014606 [Oculina patagonica]